MTTIKRRSFLKLSGVAATATVTGLPTAGSATAKAPSSTLRLGLASYSLRNFDLDETLAMTKTAGLDYLCLKSMHLPLDASPQNLKEAAGKIKTAGLTLYSVGVIYMKSKAEVDQAFEYAKNAGVNMIIGVPQHDLLSYTNDKIKQYDIKVAIHNHGPGDLVYPSPQSVYEKIKDLDPRFGLCMDIGHTQRIGVDPIEALKKYFDRMLDIHIKDVSSVTAEGQTTEIGRGVINIPKFLRTLIDKQYSGVLAFEYEKDEHNPMPGLRESVGYVNGSIDTMQ
ncbi:MAG: TIM barrel protein [Cyclobacteriaceae bacterium]|nr:TIM barrel protein [Cyclobacteriaceae bacterium]